MGKKKILIIEDEVALIRNLEFALKDDYEVLTATTGQAGLAKAKKEKPNLILLDILLPDTDGFTILRELKTNKQTDDVSVIVLTNLSDSITVSKIMAAGGTAYLIKADWSIGDIVKKIEENI
ncbi:MAG: hypothetical protein A2729_00665 [Candidatus Buchananbacteria bacterium RIFCSPHIGHO2_01_FULL_39_14]|uniref:Response regulatory domain-containing protein n=2 Tax=Candidatus Buchananiibacteriota TaxID=1817903 RepID=A0A1G1YQ97_9BACT|nr:MAG: hypothetical protein A2729_00665 [Candidatus Buchananbacteria bacterium RIFCSPHIGHO2_01_FULL_39_14]OGY48692.1 MAG: hypothetical protein A3D39_04440 [Candidatus Buchananbacteria bacterium RIFCSPHIGHO2_02_FULL_39_17]OGY54533.1 MAG: hypothetical protein A2912_00275 [Candidatus Buchananbacteria bacterium RIFCSPLOWO2_01_FULL_40_23b]